MKAHKFPFQQGDLDWLCSAYAPINLMYLRNDIKGIGEAARTLQALLKYIQESGNLYASLTEGVYRDDICEFLKKLGYKARKFNKPTPEDVANYAKNGAIIFLKMEGDEGFNHYTTIRTADKLHNIELFDSYGFSCIQHNHGQWQLDGQEIDILNLYTADL